MYAYVRFVNDDITEIVHVQDIKRFNVKDIRYDLKYQVKYSDGEYYPANIIYVADSVSQLKEKIKEKRVKHINKKLLKSDIDTDMEQGDMNAHSLKKLKKKEKVVVSQKINNLVVEKFKQSTMMGSSQKRQLNSSPIERDEIPEMGHCVKCREFEGQVNKNQLEIERLTRLNFELQEKVIDIHKDSQNKLLIDARKENVADAEIGVGETVGDEVHLGLGQYIKKDVLNFCWVHNVSFSAFVKEMAMAIFGREALMTSSVTGRPSNRTKGPARPQLDATKLRALHMIFEKYLSEKGLDDQTVQKELKKTRTYIAAKIADLNREPRKQSKTVTEEKQKEEKGFNEKKKAEMRKEKRDAENIQQTSEIGKEKRDAENIQKTSEMRKEKLDAENIQQTSDEEDDEEQFVSDSTGLSSHSLSGQED